MKMILHVFYTRVIGNTDMTRFFTGIYTSSWDAIRIRLDKLR
jgi:hypothetical protein